MAPINRPSFALLHQRSLARNGANGTAVTRMTYKG